MEPGAGRTSIGAGNGATCWLTTGGTAGGAITGRGAAALEGALRGSGTSGDVGADDVGTSWGAGVSTVGMVRGGGSAAGTGAGD